MNDILHANIFFFISSVATVIIAILISIILFYMARIIRDISEIVRKASKASADIERDFQELRSEIKTEATKVRALVDLALNFLMVHARKRTVRKSKKTESGS